MASPTILPAGAAARERAVLWSLLADAAMLGVIVSAAIVANSLTMLAETLRGTLLLALEAVLLVLMRRIHRGQVQRFDYGTAKLEQFANLGIGTAMGLSALVIGAEALARWLDPARHEHSGLIFAAAAGAANLVQNALALLALWRAGRDGTSIIMQGQIRSRLTKTLSSGLVLLSLVVGAVAGDTRTGHVAEFLGSAFVAFVMMELAVTLWRRSLPSLLDRTLDEERQVAINRVLAGHFHHYESLVSVRSRLIGDTPLVEVVLGFAPHRTVGAVQAVADAVEAEVASLVPGAQVRVTPRSA